MSRETVVAKRYARALFELAKDRNEIAKVEAELQVIVSVLRENADLRKLLEHPNLDSNVKHSMLSSLFGSVISEAVSNTLKLLVDRRREDILPDLLNDYVRIAEQELGIATAVVTTPLPLTDHEEKEIADHFGKLTGKQIRMERKVDPSLLGGMTVRIGDRLYDGSLSGRLSRLEKSLNDSQAM